MQSVGAHTGRRVGKWPAFRCVAHFSLMMAAACFIFSFVAFLWTLKLCEDSSCGVGMIIRAGFVCGMMILSFMTGALGVCAADAATLHFRRCLKSGYETLCILNAVLIGPPCILVLRYYEGHRTVMIIEMLCVVCLIITSFVGLALSCCCTPTHQGLVANRSGDHPQINSYGTLVTDLPTARLLINTEAH